MVVIYHPEMGVFVGCALGFAFWSKLDSAGQDCAVAFDNKEEARKFISDCEILTYMDELEYVNVTCSRYRYATVEDCIRAGLPAWLDSEAQTQGTA